jgi:hypothetical protein
MPTRFRELGNRYRVNATGHETTAVVRTRVRVGSESRCQGFIRVAGVSLARLMVTDAGALHAPPPRPPRPQPCRNPEELVWADSSEL